jgi:hypothetical protein
VGTVAVVNVYAKIANVNPALAAILGNVRGR